MQAREERLTPSTEADDGIETTSGNEHFSPTYIDRTGRKQTSPIQEERHPTTAALQNEKLQIRQDGVLATIMHELDKTPPANCMCLNDAIIQKLVIMSIEVERLQEAYIQAHAAYMNLDFSGQPDEEFEDWLDYHKLYHMEEALIVLTAEREARRKLYTAVRAGLDFIDELEANDGLSLKLNGEIKTRCQHAKDRTFALIDFAMVDHIELWEW